ncbi:MAG: AraC family transcriptional regulator [Pseudomonadota bacterium]
MLENYEVLRTSDFEQARDRYSASQLDLSAVQLADTRAPSKFLARGVFAPDVQIYHYCNAIDTTLIAPADNPDYWVALPVRQAIRADGSLSVRPVLEPSRIASPGAHDPLSLRAHHDFLGLSLSHKAMARFATKFLGEEVKMLRFDPNFSLDRGVHRAIANMVANVVEEDAIDPSCLADPRTLNALRDAVLSMLLLHCQHTYSSRLDTPPSAPAPRDVRRVIDLIHAAPDAALTLDDLVAEAGVPGRTLNEHFRRFTGLSPMAYLRRERLRAARRFIESGEANSVTDAATATGHWHLGRFSSAYAAMFGESPSAAMRRVRRHT